jgi:hypothetical protein
MTPQLAVSSVGGPEPWQVFEHLETTRYSLLHRVFARAQADDDPSRVSLLVTVYLSFMLVALAPLSLTAFFDLPTLTDRSTVSLPFLYDGNVLWLLAVSLPLVGVYVITDQPLLRRAVATIVRENILKLSSADAQRVVNSWNARFAATNVFAQAVAVVVGLVVAWFNYDVFSRPDVGYWTVTDGQFSATGWVYLYCIFLFYWVVSVYVVRTLVAGVFVRDLVGHGDVLPVPFHPDHCGGLRPIGVLGLRTQYILSVFGINLLLLFLIYFSLLPNMPPELYWLMMAAATVCIVLGPVVFFTPLLPFRAGMMRKKAELMNAVTQRLNSEFGRIHTKLRAEPVTKEDEDAIERLRKIGDMVAELPVWPFDALTVRKFITAYLVPVATALAVQFVKWMLEKLFYGTS